MIASYGWILYPFDILKNTKLNFILQYGFSFQYNDFDFRWNFIGVTAVEQILPITQNQSMLIGKHDLNHFNVLCYVNFFGFCYF